MSNIIDPRISDYEDYKNTSYVIRRIHNRYNVSKWVSEFVRKHKKEGKEEFSAWLNK